MDKRTTGIVAYITWIGLVIALCAGDKEGAKFHLNQSLVIMIGMTVLSILSVVAGVIPVVGLIISLVVGILSLALFVFWIMGLIAACKQEEKAVPVIGNIQLLK